MKIKQLLVDLGRLLLCSVAFIVGAVIGGVVAALLGLQQPPMPGGVDSAFAFLLLLLESPLMVFVLVLIARGLGGGALPRAIALSFFTWVAYTLNTVIETLAFTTTTVGGAWFTAVSFLVPSIACATAVALLFPAYEQGKDLTATTKAFFGRRPSGAWLWRITIAAVAFVPIYLFFGSLVSPMTAEYFQQSMYGLRQPSQGEIFLVLLVRSVLFLLACLPIVVLWQRSARNLFLSLGSALFVLVGFLYMLGAYYMPLAVRVPHTLEILAGSFAYAGVLVVLLVKAVAEKEEVVLSKGAGRILIKNQVRARVMRVSHGGRTIPWRKLIVPAIVSATFWSLAIVAWRSSGYTQPLLMFGYLGTSLGVGLGLYGTLSKKHKPIGRRLTLLLVGLFLVGFAIFMGRENVQIEGFVFGLLTGVVQMAVIHYLIAKILGPVLFGRL